MLSAVAALDVYTDSEDPNQYYYMPGFHIQKNLEGDASHVQNTHVIKQYAKAQAAIDDRELKAEEYTVNRIEKLEEKLENSKSEFQKAKIKLDEAIEGGNPERIALWRENFEMEKASFEKDKQKLDSAMEIIEKTGSLWPDDKKKSHNEHIIMQIAAAGMKVPYDEKADPDAIFNTLKDAMERFSSAYGGYLAVNVYAGFTWTQLDALRAYKAKYFPDIKVALLPLEKLTFFPLSEWHLDSSAKTPVASVSPIFRQMKGAGDYLGTAIIMDLSIAGSMGLTEHLSPFILPVGIKAVYKQEVIPTEAELHCDFGNGYAIQGRADVRDGLVIYDNDKTDTIKAYDRNEYACNLTNVSGDVNSAQFKALEILHSHFRKLFLERTTLSRQEKEKYYTAVKADIENNRRLDEPTYTQVIQHFNGTNWETIVIEGLAREADFHWHTNIQDVENISSINFHEKISINGYEKLERDMPINLCLVFNSQLNRYDRCSETETDQATSMHQAMNEAKNSSVWANTIDPFECGHKRDAAGKTPKRGYIEPEDDGLIMTRF